jgi:hypothetical protein
MYFGVLTGTTPTASAINVAYSQAGSLTDSASPFSVACFK